MLDSSSLSSRDKSSGTETQEVKNTQDFLTASQCWKVNPESLQNHAAASLCSAAAADIHSQRIPPN